MSSQFEKADEILFLLGHICTATEQLVNIIDDGICAALPGKHSRDVENDPIAVNKYAAGHLILAELDLSQRISLLGSLARMYLEGEERAALNKLLKRVDTVRKIRNARIHASWTLLGGPPTMLKKEYWRKKVEKHGPLGPPTEVEPTTLREEIDKIYQAATDLQNFLISNELSLIPASLLASGDESP